MNKKTIKTVWCALCATLVPSLMSAQSLSGEALSNAISLMDVPYVANVLEQTEEEELIINTDELDCTTFVEYVIAMTLTPKDENNDQDEDVFAGIVRQLRYRDGIIDGYTSRMHYITEWVENAVKQGLIQDVTAIQSQYTAKAKVNYMTSHPELYRHLADSPKNVERMKAIEESITGTEYHYIPKQYLPNEGFQWIQDGDIIAITTNIPGLDVAHMGVAFNIGGRLTLLHASSKDKKVEVSKFTLSKMLEDNDKWTGIRVLRAIKK